MLWRRAAALCYAGLVLISAAWIYSGSSAQPADLARSGWYFAPADTDSVAVNTDDMLRRARRFRAAADTDSVAVNDDDMLRRARRFRARVDTDSAAIDDDDMLLRARRSLARVDSLTSDTTFADSTAADTAGVAADTLKSLPFIPLFRRDRRSASLFPRRRRPLSSKLSPTWKHSIRLDSTTGGYIATETVSNRDVRDPVLLDRASYRLSRGQKGMRQNWSTLVEQRERQRRQQRRGGLGFNIVVPGGRQSAFTTIFGKPEVDLRVNGQADIRAGFDYRKSDQQVSVTGKAAQLDPDFKQDLRLGITGSIGDKMRVDVNYDTNNQFDFQNQLKLQYTGYEDEIIQSIEAGNVFLQTPSTLIRGGQSLFGIKSQFQLGGLHLTTVMSQQEGQSNSLEYQRWVGSKQVRSQAHRL